MLQGLNIYISRDIPIDRKKFWTKTLNDNGAVVSDLRSDGLYIFVEKPDQLRSVSRGELAVSHHYVRNVVKRQHPFDLFERTVRLRQQQQQPNEPLGTGDQHPATVDATDDGIAVQRPSLLSHKFHNVVLCCAGLAPAARRRLSRMAIELGGSVVHELCAEATHVVTSPPAGAPGPGPAGAKVNADGLFAQKFQFCQANRIPLVSAHWVIESHAQYDRDVPIETFLVKPFNNVMVSITGVSKPVRIHISRLVQHLGGRYCGSLERECTHLIAHRGTGDKVKWAVEKWDQPVVALRWLMHCYEQAAKLDVGPYLLCEPKTGAPTANVARFNSDQDELDVTAASVALAAAVDGGAPHPQRQQQSQQQQQQQHQPAPGVYPTPSNARAKSNAASAAAAQGVVLATQGAAGPSRTEPRAQGVRPVAAGIGFNGISFMAAPTFNAVQRRLLKERLVAVGAQLLPAGDRLHPDIPVIAAHGVKESALAAANPQCKYVTPEWLQRCVEERCMLSADDAIFYRPLPHVFPLAGANAFSVCLTGFQGRRLRDLTLLVELLGMRQNPTRSLTRETTHLVCAAPQGAKWAMARHWDSCHLVSDHWLSQCAAQGALLSERDFPVPERKSMGPPTSATTTATVGAPLPPPSTEPPPPDGHGPAMLGDAGSDDSDDDVSVSDVHLVVKRSVMGVAPPALGPSGDRDSGQQAGPFPGPVTPAHRLAPARTTDTPAADGRPGHVSVAPDAVLRGVTVYVTRGVDQRTTLHDLVAALGGAHAVRPDRSVTHVVGTRRFIDQAMAGAPNAIAVSPLWLEQSAALSTRLAEHDFPPTVDPRRCLGTVVVPAPSDNANKQLVTPDHASTADNARGYASTPAGGGGGGTGHPPSPTVPLKRVLHDELLDEAASARSTTAVAIAAKSKLGSSPPAHKRLKYKSVTVPEATALPVARPVSPMKTAKSMGNSRPAVTTILGKSSPGDLLGKPAIARPSFAAPEPVLAGGAAPIAAAPAPADAPPIYGEAGEIAMNDADVDGLLADLVAKGEPGADHDGPGRAPGLASSKRKAAADDTGDGGRPAHPSPGARPGDDSDGTVDSFAAALRLAPSVNLRVSVGGFDGADGGAAQSSVLVGASTSVSHGGAGAAGGGAGEAGGRVPAKGSNKSAAHNGANSPHDQNDDDDDGTLLVERERAQAQARARERERLQLLAAERVQREREARRRRERRRELATTGGGGEFGDGTGPAQGEGGGGGGGGGGGDTLPLHDSVLTLDDFDEEDDTMAESVAYGLHDEEMAKQAEVWRKVRAANNPSALRVAVTSVTDADRAELSRLKLVADQSVIPDVTTHVVAGHLVKSEKFLLGCALGIWVLRPSFLRDSKPGQFAPCEAHEWNLEALVADLSGGGGTATKISQTQRWLADAPRQNRVKRDAKKGMAFAGWRIMLFSNAKNLSALVNVVKAGHGQVVESIDQPEAQSLTHVLLVCQEALPDPVRARLIEMNVPACSLDLLFYTLSRPARKPDVRAAQWRVKLSV